MLHLTIQHQLDQRSRALLVQEIAGVLASQNADLLKKVQHLMSTLDDKIKTLSDASSALAASAASVEAAVTTLKSATSEPTTDQLAALDKIASDLEATRTSLDATAAPAAG